MNNRDLKVIAFYLPQFYPFKENDEWWGKGFTEWTNVGKAKSLFRGHYQPRIPADLGYYDLRVKEVRKQQAEMAHQAGVSGFCYWHYWFETNKQMMTEVFDEVLVSGEPDFPFCLGWANHSWFAKTWNKDVPDKLLCEQRYLGEEDYKKHFEYVLPAFKDYRYMTLNDCPIFYIFDPIQLPEDFIPYWNNLAAENGIKKICFVARMVREDQFEKIIAKGIDFVVPERVNTIYTSMPRWKRMIYRGFKLFSSKTKFSYDYSDAAKCFVNEDFDTNENVISFIMPQWDHSPRSGNRGTILYNSTPEKFREHLKHVLGIVRGKKNKIVFLKSWNEWAEGNYMEPDLKYGMGFIDVLGEEVSRFNKI